MQITRFSDYALRVLIYLAAEPERASKIAQIAQRYDISRNHLMKVVHRLGALGYVETFRGKNGGIRLARAPQEINVGALLRETESGSALIECFGVDNRCVITPVCRLKHILAEALDCFYQCLAGYTLADLVQGETKNMLVSLLELNFPHRDASPSGGRTE